MVKVYMVPTDFSVSSPSFDIESESSFNIPAGDEVSAAESVASSIHGEFSGNPIDEWSDLLGGSPSLATTTLESLVDFNAGDVVYSDQVKVIQESEAQDVSVEFGMAVDDCKAEVAEETGGGECCEGIEGCDQPEGEKEQLEQQPEQQPEPQQQKQQTWTVTANLFQSNRTARDEISSRIISVKTDIRSIDSEISDLAAQLKELKKTRGEKLEMLLELAEELESACDSLPVGNEFGTVTATHDGEQSKEPEVDSQSSIETAQQDLDTYNPWEKWEQGDTISVVRVLVDQQPSESGYVVEAGSALETFDIQPPQDTGDSLSGDVTAFIPNSRETIVLSKKECCPLVHWIPEAKVGWRIGEAPAGKVEKLRSNEPLTTGDEQDDSWRLIPVGELHLPKSLETILIEDNSIATIGDIAEWTRWKRLTDLKKVGEAKAEKIQEALDRFWATWSGGE